MPDFDAADAIDILMPALAPLFYMRRNATAILMPMLMYAAISLTPRHFIFAMIRRCRRHTLLC